jgi:hypothetical protein
MTTAEIKKRVRALERQRHRRWCEEAIRQFDNRSEEELEFCAQHGYFANLNDSKRKVTSEELRTFEKGLNDFQRGKSSADFDYV